MAAGSASVWCHNRTHAPQQTAILLDDAVGHRKQVWWNFDRERLCSLEVDNQLEFSWLFDRQIGRLGAL
jgi:plasmid maintenance system antidote protein VapI